MRQHSGIVLALHEDNQSPTPHMVFWNYSGMTLNLCTSLEQHRLCLHQKNKLKIKEGGGYGGGRRGRGDRGEEGRERWKNMNNINLSDIF